MKITIDLTDRQASGYQAEADKFNTEKTAELARKQPPEVWVDLTMEERFEMRMAAVGDRHAEEFIKLSREVTIAKIKDIPEADWAAIKLDIDAKVPDVTAEADVEAPK